MPTSKEEIKASAKSYILDNFLPGESPEMLTESTPLISGGIVDSIGTVQLVTFLEETFDVKFEAHELSADFLDNLDAIAETVSSKQ